MPTLETERLVLRPFASTDAPAVQRLAGVREVAETTLTIPHPYPDGAAEVWIEGHARRWDAGEALVLALTEEAEGLVGAMGLDITLAHRRAKMGYWVGVPFWNRGYATESARAMIGYAFDELGLNRIEAQYLTRNPASAKVMEKLGMRPEGIRRQHLVKWDVAEDVGLCAILASDHLESESVTPE